MTEIKFTPTTPEAQEYEWTFNFVAEAERISMELSEEELQVIVDGLRAERTELPPAAAKG
jgi:hypothetical protein